MTSDHMEYDQFEHLLDLLLTLRMRLTNRMNSTQRPT